MYRRFRESAWAAREKGPHGKSFNCTRGIQRRRNSADLNVQVAHHTIYEELTAWVLVVRAGEVTHHYMEVAV